MKRPKEYRIEAEGSPKIWPRVRGALMVGIACLTSPCCTPLIVPLLLALLAGTPVAIWLSAHIGWVYGTLTVISFVTWFVGFRWLGQKHEVKGSDEKTRQPIQLTMPELENS